MTLPSFCKDLSEERFDELLELSSWMKTWSNALEDTNHCEPGFHDLQLQSADLADAIKESGFTWEQVETIAFDLAE